MSRYDYCCSQCGHRFEILFSFSSRGIRPGLVCPSCGSKGLVEVSIEQIRTYPMGAAEIRRYLPGTDCGKCGHARCVDFAHLVAEQAAAPRDCLALNDDFGKILQRVVDFQPVTVTYDKRKPTVAGSYGPIGRPTTTSPILVTGNFAGTVNLLRAILDNAGISVHLLTTDTRGLSVESAIEARWFRPFSVFAALSHVTPLVRHRTLVIPGFAASLRGEIQRVTRWKVVVGPESAHELPLFLHRCEQRSLAAAR